MHTHRAPTRHTEATAPHLITRETAAKRYAISLRHLDDLIAEGVIPATRLGRSVRIPVSQADRAIEALTVGGVR